MKQTFYTIVAFVVIFIAACTKDGASSSADGSSSNGSLTRFITVGNYLYTVDFTNLKAYDIANPATPVLKTTTAIGFNIETIFPYGDKLFIGSNQNMFIYSISNPEAPTKLAEVAYFVRGRDPIVVKDTVAYSTLRFGTSGSLSVFNIKNINTPINVNTTFLSSPYGLGIKDSALYICEGQNGLKIFSIYKPHLPVLKKQISNTETFYDVIVEDNILFCYIKGGIYLYDISNIYNPAFISFIKN